MLLITPFVLTVTPLNIMHIENLIKSCQNLIIKFILIFNFIYKCFCDLCNKSTPIRTTYKTKVDRLLIKAFYNCFFSKCFFLNKYLYCYSQSLNYLMKT